jgi:hypothetical protein
MHRQGQLSDMMPRRIDGLQQTRQTRFNKTRAAEHEHEHEHVHEHEHEQPNKQVYRHESTLRESTHKAKIQLLEEEKTRQKQWLFHWTKNEAETMACSLDKKRISQKKSAHLANLDACIGENSVMLFGMSVKLPQSEYVPTPCLRLRHECQATYLHMHVGTARCAHGQQTWNLAGMVRPADVYITSSVRRLWAQTNVYILRHIC